MSGVTIWQGGWQSGKSMTLNPGIYNSIDLNNMGMLNYRSIKITDGYEAVVHQNGDLTSPYWILCPNSNGYYEDLNYWLPIRHALVVKEVPNIKAKECVLAYSNYSWHHGRGNYGAYWAVPPSDSAIKNSGDHYFSEDQITDLIIPTKTRVILYEYLNGQGSSRILKQGIYNTQQYGFGNKIASMKIQYMTTK